MKKIGILVFVIALVAGIFFARAFGVGTSFIGLSFNKIKGSGNIAVEKRDLIDFDSVEAGGVMDVEVVSQKDFSIEVQADDNILPYIKTEVDDGKLKVYKEGFTRLSPSGRIVVRISMPSTKGVEINGVSSAKVVGVNEESLEVRCNGASKMSISGSAINVFMKANGASSINAEELATESSELKANGASQIVIQVKDSIDASANGASKISYIGSPANVDKRSSGASSIFQSRP
jgi:hypothetical protein